MDFGLLGRSPFQRLTWGASVRNVGPGLQYSGDKYALPLSLSFGTAFRLASPLTLSCDVLMRPRQNQTSVSIGSSFYASQNVTLRAGYLARLAQTVQNSQKSETERGSMGISGMAGGLGLSFGQFMMDYSLTPFGELGTTQTLTLSTWFGGNRDEDRAAPPVAAPEETPAAAPADDRVILIIGFPDSHESWWEGLK
jgi:hypothetical protein